MIMKRAFTPRAAAFGAALLISLAADAGAQIPPLNLSRTYVSVGGSDANACTRAAPCRYFQAGVNAVASGGEVVALDSGTYGAVKIGKSVTLVAAPGVYADITTAQTAVEITSDSAVVRLRGLTLKGIGGEAVGVTGLGWVGTELYVEDCVVRDFATGVGAQDRTSVTNSSFLKNETGITMGQGRLTVTRSRFERNGTGVRVEVSSDATVIDCVASGNQTAFVASMGAGMVIDRCTISHNGTGISAGAGYQMPASTVVVSNSTITGNDLGMSASGGASILSRSPATNTVTFNGSGQNFTGTLAAK
jgi:hypothetical protein